MARHQYYPVQLEGFGGDRRESVSARKMSDGRIMSINCFKDSDAGSRGETRETEVGIFHFAKQYETYSTWIHEDFWGKNPKASARNVEDRSADAIAELFEKADDNRRIERDSLLPTDSRHEQYSRFKQKQTPDVRIQLLGAMEGRGMNAHEIANAPFIALRGLPHIPHAAENLPGVTKVVGSVGGLLGNLKKDSMLFPVINVEGEIAGYQVRPFQLKSGDAKYVWMSTRDNPAHTHEFNELPLAVHFPSELRTTEIFLCEGVGFKPYLAAERLGAIVIGAAGNQFTSSPATLIHTLAVLSAAMRRVIGRGREPRNYAETKIASTALEGLKIAEKITIIPDAGFALNTKVLNQNFKIADFLTAIVKSVAKEDGNVPEECLYLGGHTVGFLDYNQIHKSAGDIDEILNPSAVGRISATSFKKKYEKCDSRQFKEWYEHNTLFSPLETTAEQKFLSITEKQVDSGDFIVYRKSLGGGKTEAVLNHLWNTPCVPALLIGYRNNLSNNTLARARKKGMAAFHTSQIDPKLGIPEAQIYGGCIDSFHKFRAIANKVGEYVVVIDEICSVLRHLQSAGTLKSRQETAIGEFEDFIRGASKVLLLDGNITDSEVAFLQKIFYDKKIHTVLSPAKAEDKAAASRDITFLHTLNKNGEVSRDGRYLPAALLDKAVEVSARLGRKARILYLSDSQTACEEFEKLYEGDDTSKHFRLDRKITGSDDPNDQTLVREFLADPARFIHEGGIESVSISPSGNSGLDISEYDQFVGLFDVILMNVTGCLDTKGILQLAGRYREWSVPMFVACPEFVNRPVDHALLYGDLEEVLKSRSKAAVGTMKKMDSELDSNLVSSGFSDLSKSMVGSDWFKKNLEEMRFQHFEQQNMALCLATMFQFNGHKIHNEDTSPSLDMVEAKREAREQIKQQEGQDIFKAEKIDKEEAKTISQKGSVTQNESNQLARHYLVDALPGIEETPSWGEEFVRAVAVDNKRSNPVAARRRYHQLVDEEFASVLYAHRKHKKLYYQSFERSDILSDEATTVRLFRELGIGKVIESGSFSTSDALVQQIVKEYCFNRDLRNCLKLKPMKIENFDNPSTADKRKINALFKNILSWFGFEKSGKKSGSHLIEPASWYKNEDNESEEIADYLADIDLCLMRDDSLRREYLDERNITLGYAQSKGIENRQNAQP